MRDCPNCKGTGKVLLNVYQKPCPICGGKGKMREVEPLLPSFKKGD